MATGKVFNISRNIAKGYKVPRGRPITPNGAGVTAIMGLTNGIGASERHRRSQQAYKQCRDEDGRFTECSGSSSCARPNSRSGRRRSGRASIKGKRGGATCWKKPRIKYVRMGATRRADYAYPGCWAYPVKGRGKWGKILPVQAAKWFSVHKGKYTSKVRSSIDRRIKSALRSAGVGSGRTRRARRNEGESDMIVMEPIENARRRGKRYGKGRGKSKRWGAGSARSVMVFPRGKRLGVRMRRNEDLDDMTTSLDSSSDVGVFESNRRGKRRGKRRSAKRSGRWGRRVAARRTRRVSRKRSYGRRRGSARKRSYGRRKSVRRGRGRKSFRRARRNGMSANPFDAQGKFYSGAGPGGAWSPAMKARLAAMRAARGGKVAGRFPAELQAMRAQAAQRQLAFLRHRMGMGAGAYGGGGLFTGMPWVQATYARRAARKAERDARKQQRLGRAIPAVRSGIFPRDIAWAMKQMTAKQVERLFPDYYTYRMWMKSMGKDRRFRRYSKKYRFGGKRRGYGKRRFGRGRRRWFGGKRRFGRGRRRGYGKRRGSRRSRWFGGRGRRRGMRRGRWSRRMRRNFNPNIPFGSVGDLLKAGLLGLGTFAIIKAVSNVVAKYNPTAGAAVGLALGAAAAFGSDRVFTNDSYVKATATAGIISMLSVAANAVLGMISPGSSLMGVGTKSTTARYVNNPFGAYYEAQAGLGAPGFQQALAAPFYQAQAGFGEYYNAPAGMGEYVSDGSLAPVSDFGEYVANRLSVEGYGDYEVMPGYAPSADGVGFVNDGVRPDANLDHEFNIMEAAAGLGAASPQGRSDYVPTVQSGTVSSAESNADSGIFDVGGPNGVFG